MLRQEFPDPPDRMEEMLAELRRASSRDQLRKVFQFAYTEDGAPHRRAQAATSSPRT